MGKHKPEISKADRRKLVNLKKKKTGVFNERHPVSPKFFKVLETFLTKNSHVIFLYQIYNAMALNKDSFYIYCKEFDEAGHMDTPIVDELRILLDMNKSSVTESLRHDWLTDEKRTSPAERILLYKLCSTRDELDIINDTHEKSLENNFVVTTPLIDSSKLEEYSDTVEILNELDGE